MTTLTTPMTMARAAVAAALLLFVAGCGLRLQLVDASVRHPSNVAVYFGVTDGHKDPVAGLTANDFKIYEDDKLVSVYESKQTILNPEVAAVQYTLLLMDMSGSVTESGRVGELTEAASLFADRVGKTQQVAVYAFDGGKDIHPIVGFSSGGGSVKGAVSGLAGYKSRDPSTNLNGAVVEALKVLEHQMEHSDLPLRFGTLVVFTDGSDRAHRVPRDKTMEALDDLSESMNVFVIGVGAEIDEGELKAIGRTGAVLSKNPAEVKQAFEKIAGKVEGFTKSFYLLSYCSPSRAGEHEVEIKADAKDRGAGGLRYHFKADGFGPNCDPNQKPSFDVHHPRGLRKPKAERAAEAARKPMKPTKSDQSASALIDQRIVELGDWRGKTLAKVRRLIKEADPEIVEEWKWRGTPTWSHGGLICTGETYKSIVKMTFAKGAALADPAGLFNASLDGNVRRAIDLHEDDRIDEPALKRLVASAVALNLAGKKGKKKA
jgi:hypothetical protein